MGTGILPLSAVPEWVFFPLLLRKNNSLLQDISYKTSAKSSGIEYATIPGKGLIACLQEGKRADGNAKGMAGLKEREIRQAMNGKQNKERGQDKSITRLRTRRE